MVCLRTNFLILWPHAGSHLGHVHNRTKWIWLILLLYSTVVIISETTPNTPFWSFLYSLDVCPNTPPPYWLRSWCGSHQRCPVATVGLGCSLYRAARSGCNLRRLQYNIIVDKSNTVTMKHQHKTSNMNFGLSTRLSPLSNLFSPPCLQDFLQQLSESWHVFVLWNWEVRQPLDVAAEALDDFLNSTGLRQTKRKK